MLTGLMTPPPHQVPKKYSTKRCELRLIMPTRSPGRMPLAQGRGLALHALDCGPELGAHP
eukprot:gene32563-43500_t